MRARGERRGLPCGHHLVTAPTPHVSELEERGVGCLGTHIWVPTDSSCVCSKEREGRGLTTPKNNCPACLKSRQRFYLCVRGGDPKTPALSLDYGADLESATSWRQHHYCWRRTFPLLKVHFQSSFIGEKVGKFHTSFQGIVKCDVHFCWDLYAIIVLTVGTTMFQKFGDRSTKESIPRLSPGPIVLHGGPPKSLKFTGRRGDLRTRS